MSLRRRPWWHLWKLQETQKLLSSFKSRRVELRTLPVPSLMTPPNYFQAKASPIRTKLPVSLALLLERTISALLLLSMESQSSCILITVPRNCSPGLMECWMKMKNISRSMENHFSGTQLTYNSLS